MTYLNPTLITFVFYIIAMIAIGLYAYRATSNFDEYILGGRSLGSVVTALSAGASDMSGWLLMGLPGAIYLSGLSEAWIAVGLIIGAWLNWLLVTGRWPVTCTYRISEQCPDLAGLFHQPFFRPQAYFTSLVSPGDSGVLCNLLRLGYGCRRTSV